MKDVNKCIVLETKHVHLAETCNPRGWTKALHSIMHAYTLGGRTTGSSSCNLDEL